MLLRHVSCRGATRCHRPPWLGASGRPVVGAARRRRGAALCRPDAQLGRIEPADRRRSPASAAAAARSRTCASPTRPADRRRRADLGASATGIDPLAHTRAFHAGLDCAARDQVPPIVIGRRRRRRLRRLQASATTAGWSRGVDHGNGLATRYAHASELLVRARPGRRPRRPASPIVGSTGRATGLHHHFEVLRAGDHVDPRRYLGGPVTGALADADRASGKRRRPADLTRVGLTLCHRAEPRAGSLLAPALVAAAARAGSAMGSASCCASAREQPVVVARAGHAEPRSWRRRCAAKQLPSGERGWRLQLSPRRRGQSSNGRSMPFNQKLTESQEQADVCPQGPRGQTQTREGAVTMFSRV